jgi:DNA (cytosine-5)-methyltransferase 1
LDGGSNSRKALKKKLLPTPDASQRGPTKDYDPKAKSQSGRTLQSFAAKFPTPQASDYITKKTSASWKAKGGVNFSLSNPEIQAKWPTPRSCSAMAATITPESAWNEKRNPNLETIVGQRLWPTPQASDNRDRGNMSNPSIQRRIAKGKQIMLSQSVHPTSGQLNPPWVEWLMGWPIGWTDLKPLEMDKSHFVQQQPGDC